MDDDMLEEHNGVLVKRQSCHGAVPISTRYTIQVFTTYRVSYSETPTEPTTSSTRAPAHGPRASRLLTLQTIVFTPQLPTSRSSSPPTIRPPSKRTPSGELVA
ncbi:hypothetical protein FRC06_001545 [Ceratobasidium sp. 370]|nr:hypothetical protein FRC06_001545 [Ceratobasidium sp. 370]